MSFLSALNFSRCQGNMEKSILNYDSANCDPLISENVTKFEKANLFSFLINAGKTAWEGYISPPSPPPPPQ